MKYTTSEKMHKSRLLPKWEFSIIFLSSATKSVSKSRAYQILLDRVLLHIMKYSKTCQSRNLSMPETSQSRTFFDTSQFFHTFWPLKDGKSSNPEAGNCFWNAHKFFEHFYLWDPENLVTWTKDVFLNFVLLCFFELSKRTQFWVFTKFKAKRSI